MPMTDYHCVKCEVLGMSGLTGMSRPNKLKTRKTAQANTTDILGFFPRKQTTIPVSSRTVRYIIYILTER